MNVRLKGDISGSRNGAEWPKRGTVVDLPQEEAVALLESGMAEAVSDTPPVETATAPKAAVKHAAGRPAKRG